MKANDFLAFIATNIADNNAALVNTQALIADATNVDTLEELKDVESTIKHRLRFLAMLNNETVAKDVQSLKVAQSSFEALFKDAKSIAKAVELFAATRNERTISADADDALAQAVAHFVATDFASITAEQLRRKLFSKRSNYTEQHTTKRQSQMILNLLVRLNVCTKVDKETFSFSDNVFTKKLRAAYTIH